MQSEWINLFSVNLPTTRSKRRKSSMRLQRGLRTPEDAFRQPILEALVELGGSGTLEQVLEIVGKKMENILNGYDRMPLPSDPSSIRWKNTAQWCRNTMVREGLLKADSPRGIWEISDKGREEVERCRPRI
ncbi:MAG: winged helix-turn-helix domain-containing protein [Candidatus Methanomethyliaceae archaeon]